MKKLLLFGVFAVGGFLLGQAAIADAVKPILTQPVAAQPMQLVAPFDPNAIVKALFAYLWGEVSGFLTPALIASGMASVLAALLPHPAPGSPASFLRQVIDLLALNVANAANAKNITHVQTVQDVKNDLSAGKF